VVVCTPDKDLAQCVTGERVVQLDRRTGRIRDEAGVREKFGVGPSSIPDWLALVGDTADGFPGLPGWGAKSAAAVLAHYETIEAIPDRALDWLRPALKKCADLGLVVLVFALGQLISNMATALIVIPIAVSAAGELDVSPKPVLMAVCVASAAAFLTPVATPANLMVLSPGGYRFGDYWKLGLPLIGLFGAVAVLLVPVIWSF